jgi:tetratricopeptide (TPR) repeat protein
VVETNVLLGLGSTLVRTDDIAAGEAMLKDAIALATSVHGPDTVVVAKGESYLAEAYAATGRREEAAKLMDRAVATMRARLPPDDYQLLRAYSRYGSLLLALGEPKRAEEVVLELQKQRASLAVRDSSLLANSYMALGAVYYNQGRAVEATGQITQALELAEHTLDDGDAQLAAYRNSLGVILAERGAYARAADLVGRALATVEAAPERNALTIVKYRQNLGVPLMRGGRADEALRVLSLPVGEGEDRDWALNRQLQRLSLAEWHLRHGTPAEAGKLLDEAELHIDDAGGAKSNRYGQLLRLRALLEARSDAKSETAWSTLLRAHEVMAAARGADSIGAGEVALDLAELARGRGDAAAEAKWSAEARRVLAPALVEDAPQRARLAALARG